VGRFDFNQFSGGDCFGVVEAKFDDGLRFESSRHAKLRGQRQQARG
jgi:hypothetical protein